MNFIDFISFVSQSGRKYYCSPHQASLFLIIIQSGSVYWSSSSILLSVYITSVLL